MLVNTKSLKWNLTHMNKEWIQMPFISKKEEVGSLINILIHISSFILWCVIL